MAPAKTPARHNTLPINFDAANFAASLSLGPGAKNYSWMYTSPTSDHRPDQTQCRPLGTASVKPTGAVSVAASAGPSNEHSTCLPQACRRESTSRPSEVAVSTLPNGHNLPTIPSSQRSLPSPALSDDDLELLKSDLVSDVSKEQLSEQEGEYTLTDVEDQIEAFGLDDTTIAKQTTGRPRKERSPSFGSRDYEETRVQPARISTQEKTRFRTEHTIKSPLRAVQVPGFRPMIPADIVTNDIRSPKIARYSTNAPSRSASTVSDVSAGALTETSVITRIQPPNPAQVTSQPTNSPSNHAASNAAVRVLTWQVAQPVVPNNDDQNPTTNGNSIRRPHGAQHQNTSENDRVEAQTNANARQVMLNTHAKDSVVTTLMTFCATRANQGVSNERVRWRTALLNAALTKDRDVDVTFLLIHQMIFAARVAPTSLARYCHNTARLNYALNYFDYLLSSNRTDAMEDQDAVAFFSMFPVSIHNLSNEKQDLKDLVTIKALLFLERLVTKYENFWRPFWSSQTLPLRGLVEDAFEIESKSHLISDVLCRGHRVPPPPEHWHNDTPITPFLQSQAQTSSLAMPGHINSPLRYLNQAVFPASGVVTGLQTPTGSPQVNGSMVFDQAGVRCQVPALHQPQGPYLSRRPSSNHHEQCAQRSVDPRRLLHHHDGAYVQLQIQTGPSAPLSTPAQPPPTATHNTQPLPTVNTQPFLFSDASSLRNHIHPNGVASQEAGNSSSRTFLTQSALSPFSLTGFSTLPSILSQRHLPSPTTAPQAMTATVSSGNQSGPTTLGDLFCLNPDSQEHPCQCLNCHSIQSASARSSRSGIGQSRTPVSYDSARVIRATGAPAWNRGTAQQQLPSQQLQSPLSPSNPGAQNLLFPRPGQYPSQWAIAEPQVTALHQIHRRSPELRLADTVSDRQDRRLQYFSGWLLEPSPMPFWEAPIIEWDFDMSATEFSAIPQTSAAAHGRREERTLKDDSRLYRLRCVDRKPANASEWTTTATYWPQKLYFMINGKFLEPRRGLQWGSDLPIDISQYLQAGKNVLRMCSIPKKDRGFDYHVAIETISWMTHSQCIKQCTSRHLQPSIMTKRLIMATVGSDDKDSDDDDEISVLTESLNINLYEPFSGSRIFDIPVRGPKCTHFDCFDLETFLQTRKSVAPGISSHDEWRCPICRGDARPSHLVVDQFMVEVRKELAGQGKLNTRSIVVDKTGKWWPKEEAEMNTSSLKRKNSGEDAQSGASFKKANTNKTLEVVVLD